MKIARFRSNGRTAFGVIQGDEVVEIRGSIYTRFRLTDTKYPLQEVKLLPPTEPTEIWCPGLNFANHLEFAAGVLGDENPKVPEQADIVGGSPQRKQQIGLQFGIRHSKIQDSTLETDLK